MLERFSIYLFLVVLSLLVACSSPPAEPQAETQAEFEPTATIAPTFEPSLPANTEVATQTQVATVAPTETPTTEIATQTQVATVVPTETPTVTATVVPDRPTQLPRETKTGIPQVDLVIDAILSNDLDARQALVRFVTAGCTTADGLGSMPPCKDAQPEGTLVDYLPIGGPGEGSYVLASEVASLLEFEAETLYGAYVVSGDLPDEPEFPRGTYALFFTTSGGESGAESVVLRVDDEGYIVRLDGLGGMPIDFYFQQMVADLIDPPPQSVIFSSESAEILVYPPETD